MEALCEVCEQRPAKMVCEDCCTILCPKDVKQHKEDMPDCPHHVVSLKPKSMAAEASPPLPSPLMSEVPMSSLVSGVVTSEPEQTADPYKPERPEIVPTALDPVPPVSSEPKPPIEESKESPPLSAPKLPEIPARPPDTSKEDFIPSSGDSEDLSDEPMDLSTTAAESEASVVLSSAPTSRLDLKFFRIFSSHVDVAQTFKLHKWMINPLEAAELVRAMTAAGTPFKVLGTYGPLDVSMRCIRSILGISADQLHPPDDPKEGIVAYLRTDTQTLCFYFKIEHEKTYLSQPYPSSSREAVYLRLLFDLCPVVICCISEEIQRNWYWTTDSQRKNPFLPKTHKGMIVKVNRRKVHSADIEEIPVKLPRGLTSKFALTSDHWPYLFKAEHNSKNFSRQAQLAIEQLKSWIASLKSSNSYSSYSSSSYSSDSWSSSSSHSYHSEYNSGTFHTFTNALKALTAESTAVVTTVKEKHSAMKKAIHSEAELHVKTFFSEFKTAFETKSEYTDWKYSITTWDNFYARIWEAVVDKREYKNWKTYSNEAKKFVIRIIGQDESSEKQITKAVKVFFGNGLTLLKQQLEADFQSRFHTFETELTELITQLATRNIEEYSIKTLALVITDEAVTVQEREIESRFTLRGRPSDVSLHTLEKDVAFAIARGINQTFKYNPLAGFAFEIEELLSIRSCPLIASGSTASLFVAFYNEEQKAIYGAAQEMKHIDRGIPLKVYGEEVHQVRSACVLQKTRRILLINESGNVHFMELVCNVKRLSPVMVDCREERVSEEGLPLEPAIIRKPLTPTNGSSFYDVKSSVDETLYFFLTDVAIEVYDLNYLLSKAIVLSEPCVSFKVLASESYNIILAQCDSRLKAYRFQSEMERVESSVEETKREIIPGNPIIDILFHAFFKFGHHNPVSEDKAHFYIYSDILKPQCENYLESIQLLSQALRFRGTLTASSPERLASLVSDALPLPVEAIKWSILTRAPLHLCSIQDGNLIPLQDGLNNFEEFIGQISESKTDFVTSFVSYIRLAGLESIIREADSVKVVAIIGRQSSGKSYLLNRLFGTRFDVAAHRCTDGIWLSVSRLQNQTFLILDCEGLFSVERSVQEEIKLCLLLAAIADVTILNQDLTFNRNLSFLFEKFTFGIDRLKGSKLFKGCLEIAIRDVAANQDDGANAEVRKFVDKMIEANKADFLIKLFGGTFMCCSYHNFENEQLFEAAVVSRRQFYLEEIGVRWTSGDEFLIILKTVMAQIYADDATSIDSRTFQLKLSKISADLKSAIENPAEAKELVSPVNPSISVSFTINEKAYEFKLNLFDFQINLKSKYLAFSEYMEKYVPAEVRVYQHNEWYQSLEHFMKLYFEAYKSTLFEHFANAAGITEEFRPIFDGEKYIMEKMFDNVLLLSHTLCRRKCKFCDLCCVKPQNHSENCDCSTSHQCLYSCSICKDSEKCSQNAGHTGSHICSSKPHTCGLPCGLDRCKGICTAIPNHGDTHRCSAATHPCGAECSIFHLCKRTCEIDQVVSHSVHNCGQRNCPYLCDLCKGEFISQCMSQDHLHYLSKDPAEITSPETGHVKHFCSKEHPCTISCQEEGICEIESVTQKRVWHNEFNTFTYTYVSQRAIKSKCSTPIPVKNVQHSGKHNCSKEEHKCSAICPDCGAYCEQSFGHDGVHSTAAHRNKERCIYVAKNEGIEIDVEEESGKTTRKLKAGESAKPEFCDQSCARKGRGHTHAMECKGGEKCLQVACAGRAIHSKDRYHPDLDRVYDLVECDTYWRLKEWEPPVFKKSPASQSLFALCPFYCASAEHSEKVYCDAKLFHSNSMVFKDHVFPTCAHRSSSELDIVFVLDCTGSMGSSFPQVKKVITDVFNQYKDTALSNKFAIVGYTDHAPHNGDFPLNPPISIYPPTRQLKDFNMSAALTFLNSLRANGGGSGWGEAMIDGMNAANMLSWRPLSSRILFIIGDDCPHGDIFAPGTAYPSGCPCGLNWKTLLATMKSNKTEVRFVNLTSITNKTADLFKTEYGEGFQKISLESMTNIGTEVVKSIVAVIEHNLEFALD